MGDYIGNGRMLVAKADKKLNSWSMFGNKFDDASELLEKAASQFKLGKAWSDAGQTYERLAELYLKQDSRHEAASSCVEAAKCYQKTNKMDVLRALHRAVDLFTDMGRLSMAAKNLREVAETLEKENKKADSIEFFRQAADLFAGEEQISEANKCRLKVATFSSELGQYSEAIQIFEEVATRCVDNNLLKYSAKGYLLNAGICHLCTSDKVALQRAVERYDGIDINFADSREGRLFKDLVDSFEAGDLDKFTDAIADFDSMTRLDQWKTKLLLIAKKRIEAADGEEEEDLT